MPEATGPDPPKESKQTDGTVPDPTDVFWDGDADPLNPRNWSVIFRWSHIMVISLLTFTVSLSSSMLAPAVPEVTKSFNSNNPALDSFVVSVYVIGYALGPLAISPMSELYGRAVVYQVSNFLFLGFTIGCALSTNIGMFTAFRFLCGCVGVTPIALGGGSIGDIMPPEKLGMAMAIWGLGSLVAPVLAPVAGGYLSEGPGWRWIFWVIAIIMGVLTISSLPLLRETYAPVILERKAKRLRKETGNAECKSRFDSQDPLPRVISRAFARPIKLLLTSPIVFVLSLEVAVAYGYTYLVFTSLSYIFQERYQFSSGLSGVAFLGNGIGTILGVFAVGMASDTFISRKQKANKELHSEDWLWPLVPAGPLVAIGLFWYGWSLHTHSHPVVPLVGLGVFSFGTMAIFQPVQAYLINCFPVHSVTAIAASNLLRSLAGGLLPLSGHKMYDVLGLGWGNSLLAFISLVLVPIPILLIRHGGRMRARDRNIK